MDGVKTTIRNKDRVFRKLKKTVPDLDKNLRGALSKSGDEWVDRASDYVPRRSGALAQSIGWTFGTVPQTARLFSRGGSRDAGGSPVITLYAGDDEAFYAGIVEHGHAGAPAQPYFWPSYRLLRRKIKSRLSRVISKTIKKAGF